MFSNDLLVNGGRISLEWAIFPQTKRLQELMFHHQKRFEEDSNFKRSAIKRKNVIENNVFKDTKRIRVNVSKDRGKWLNKAFIYKFNYSTDFYGVKSNVCGLRVNDIVVIKIYSWEFIISKDPKCWSQSFTILKLQNYNLF